MTFNETYTNVRRIIFAEFYTFCKRWL